MYQTCRETDSPPSCKLSSPTDLFNPSPWIWFVAESIAKQINRVRAKCPSQLWRVLPPVITTSTTKDRQSNQNTTRISSKAMDQHNWRALVSCTLIPYLVTFPLPSPDKRDSCMPTLCGLYFSATEGDIRAASVPAVHLGTQACLIVAFTELPLQSCIPSTLI